MLVKIPSGEIFSLGKNTAATDPVAVQVDKQCMDILKKIIDLPDENTKKSELAFQLSSISGQEYIKLLDGMNLLSSLNVDSFDSTTFDAAIDIFVKSIQGKPDAEVRALFSMPENDVWDTASEKIARGM